MKDLIAERTESGQGSIGGFFKMNPKVDDLPDILSGKLENIKLMRLGGVKKGGGGCICPESVLLKSLVAHIVLARDEAVILDMEAGIEHLGRATAGAVDSLIVVTEPGRRSIETAGSIRRLANEIGLKNIFAVGNKIRSEKDKKFLSKNLPGFNFLGFLPYDDALIESDLTGKSPYDMETSAKAETEKMIFKLQ